MVRPYPGGVTLADDIGRITDAAAPFAADGEELAGVIAAEPEEGRRVYLCAYAGKEGRTWLALDAAGTPVESRTTVREAVSIAAMCELAAESAGGGDLEELRAQLLTLRIRERPQGIEEAEEAALELERVVGLPPRLASPAYLDAVGAATRRLEQALGEDGRSPFADAMKAGMGAVEELAAEVERGYKRPLR
jgi:hypothetical protein